MGTFPLWYTILTVGTYIIQLTASDGTNVNSTVITVTVHDTIAPTCDTTPTDQTVNEGHLFRYSVKTLDCRMITYSIDVASRPKFSIDSNALKRNALI